MIKETKGYIHVHSHYSHDGKNSIEELSRFFMAKDYRFICLTEHADDFNQVKMASFLKECAKCSSSNFTVVPGLEYRCRDLVHLLGIGMTQYCPVDHPADVARFIKQNGGIAIIAHPRGYEENLTDDLLSVVDGIEIWSGQKDSRFFPHWESLLTFKNLKRIYPSLIGLGGADLHTIEAYFPLDTIIKTNSETFSSSGLTNGVSSIRGAYWNLLPGSISSFQSELTLKVLRIALNMARRFMHRI
jgi:hypothetical protein